MEPALKNAHKKFKLPATLLFLMTAGALHDSLTNTARAVVFTISDGTIPELSIRVGKKGQKVDRVDFKVKAKDVGSGKPIKAKKKIKFVLYLRATAENPLTGFLTVDSATPLINGSGNTMPTSEISWTAKDGDIPSGSYLGTTNQPLASFVSSVRVQDQHTFQYKNTNVFDAGTYNGQVTYTWAAP